MSDEPQPSSPFPYLARGRARRDRRGVRPLGVARNLRGRAGPLGRPALRSRQPGVPHLHPCVSVRGEPDRPRRARQVDRDRDDRARLAVADGRRHAARREPDSRGHADAGGPRADRPAGQHCGAGILGGEDGARRDPASPGHVAPALRQLRQRGAGDSAGVRSGPFSPAGVQRARPVPQPGVRQLAELHRADRRTDRPAAGFERPARRGGDGGHDGRRPRGRVRVPGRAAFPAPLDLPGRGGGRDDGPLRHAGAIALADGGRGHARVRGHAAAAGPPRSGHLDHDHRGSAGVRVVRLGGLARAGRRSTSGSRRSSARASCGPTRRTGGCSSPTPSPSCSTNSRSEPAWAAGA